jgi:exodeoxyribonuclease V alpha subunit
MMSLRLLPPSASDRPGPPVAASLAPFVEAGVLDALACTTVDLLARRAGEHRPGVVLALALAVRAPLHGHVCVLRDGPLPEAEVPLPWPSDRAAWWAEVAGSPLVRGPGATERTPFVLDGPRLYTDRCFVDERALAGDLRALCTGGLAVDEPLLERGLRALFRAGPGPVADSPDRQLQAAARAARARFAVITGGPGTGKTWTVRNLLTLLFAQHDRSSGPLSVALAAPTGKAAARMKESLNNGLETFLEERAPGALPPGVEPAELEAFLQGLEARTVHRLLRVDPRSPGRFRHGRNNVLSLDAVVVDESSMLDLGLMARLVEAVGPQTRLVLLGDPHQLASVEAGSVLADLVSAGPPVSEHVAALTESRRFHPGSGIGAVARATLRGDGPAVLQTLRSADWPDVAHLPVEASGRPGPPVARAIVDGYRPYLQRLLAGPQPGEDQDAHERAVLKDFDRFRLLAAHRKGSLGVAGLVALTERLLARTVPGFSPGLGAYLGRPVLVTRNDYGVGLYNGDIGIVMDGPAGRRVVFADGAGLRRVPPARLPSHETVFAMTIHKSQGSEFDHTALVLPRQPSALLSRELIYTGITRARSQLTIIGRGEVLRAGVASVVERATGLVEALSAGAEST